ncbi:MAG: hypothetical protein JWN39_3185, partial [Ilumatobacteraceae bacterium]|nr:hypothetical protein [Ilumatobacteraceae bacterium]
AFDFTTFDATVPDLPATADRASEFAVGVCSDKPPAAPPDVQTAAPLDA